MFLTKIQKLQSLTVCLNSSQTQGTIASGEPHVFNHLFASVFVDNIIAKPIFNNPEWDYGDVFNRPCNLFVQFNEVKAVDGMARGGGVNGKLNCCESFSCVKAAFKMKDRSSLVIHCVACLVFVTDFRYKVILISSKQVVRIQPNTSTD